MGNFMTLSEEREKLIKLDNWFQSALDHPTWISFRKNAQKCFEYKESKQWTDEELAELKDRHQPPTVNNQVKVTIDRMTGQFVKQKTRLGYRGRNNADIAGAEALSDTYLFIKQNNSLEFEERDMAEDGFTSGFGCMEAYVTYDDIFQPEIRLKDVDIFEIFPDPYSRRYDWNEDANFICRAKWVDIDEVKELNPSKVLKITSMLSPEYKGGILSSIDSFKKDNYIDSNSRRIRLVECWYKIRRRETMMLFPDGNVIDITEAKEKEIRRMRESGGREMERVKHTMRQAVFTAGILFSDKGVKRKYYPYIPYFVHRKKDGEPFSLIFTALTMQDAINKRESKALHLLNSNQTIYEEGAIPDINNFASEIARPDGLAKVAKGAIDRIRIERNLELAATQFSMHNQGKQDFRHITGVNPDALGERSEVRSGIGIARKQAMTDFIIAPVFDNFRRSRTIQAKVVLELIQNYYTEKKIFYITDDLNATKEITINTTPENSVTKQAIYDVIVEDLPDTTTAQQEQFQMLAQALPAIIPFGPLWTRILIQASDLRNKQEILKQMEAASSPPPAEPKITVALQWNELEPAEKAAFALKMGMQNLANVEISSDIAPAHITKAKTDITREMIKARTESGKQAMEMQKEIIK